MSWIDIDDRAPCGDSRAYLAVCDVLERAEPVWSPDRVADVATRVCEALLDLADKHGLAALQRHVAEVAAAARGARDAG